MPIITIESSVPLPPERRPAVLRALVELANDRLAIVPPTQLRLRIVDVPLESIAVGDAIASAGEPWLVAFAHVLDGRPEEQLATFMRDFAGALGDAFGVDAAKVRVLVQPVAKEHWQIGRRSAAVAGR